MSAPIITRTAWTDDDGSGTTGTVINNAVKTELYGQIDALAAAIVAATPTVPVTVPNGGTGDTTLTAHGVLIGAGASAVAVSVAGAVGLPLVGAGASADPVFAVLGVVGGGTGLATLPAHGVLLGEGTSAVAVSGAGTAGQVLTSNGASADPTFQAPLGLTTLLKANSGTDVNTTGTDLDTIAISGLTVKDKIEFEVTIEAASGTAQSVLLNQSGVGALSDTHSVTTGNTLVMTGTLSRVQSADTVIVGLYSQRNGGSGQVTGTVDSYLQVAASAWTGSWTLALRYSGMTAGTAKWSWKIHKIAGQ